MMSCRNFDVRVFIRYVGFAVVLLQSFAIHVSGLTVHKRRIRVSSQRAAELNLHTNGADSHISMNCGLLFSSFSDGLRPNKAAHDFLCRGLVRSILDDDRRSIEEHLAASAVQSPCCGPNLSLVDQLQEIDNQLLHIQKHSTPASLIGNEPRSLRIVYIPTAMYALRPLSQNTPGKQRQRARADGKQRRNQIVELLQDILGHQHSILSVTLDFDDGSVKQPEGSCDKSLFPTDGRTALTSWKPHLVYIDGGNTFWLYHCIEKGGWKDDIVECCAGSRTIVSCGSSAGAIIAGSRMETACWKGWDDPQVVPGRESYDKWQDVRGLALVGEKSFFPHMEDRWQSLIEQKSKDVQVQGLREDEVLCVDGYHSRKQLFSSSLMSKL